MLHYAVWHPRTPRKLAAGADLHQRLTLPPTGSAEDAVTMGGASSKSPIKAAQNVDLKRFMGPWFVVGVIPTYIETSAFNPIESYKLEADGKTVATTFSFNNGSPTGPRKIYHPTGFVVDTVHNSTWTMMFMWPIKAEYIIAYLDNDYQQTIIARSARDYAWIMSRTPTVSDELYAAQVQRLKDMGYDTKGLIKCHQDPLPRETSF